MKRLAGVGLLCAGIFLGLGLGGCETTQRSLRPLLEARSDDTLWRYKDEPEDVVYLTIDDGPSPQTAALLDVLADFDATATLFLHTEGMSDPAVIRRALTEGHNLGNHMPADKSWAGERADVFLAAAQESHCALAQFGDGYSGHFRPPHGRINRETMVPGLASLGIDGPQTFVMASYAPWDAGGVTELEWRSAARWFARRYGAGLGKAVAPGDIVVFHDGPRYTRTENTKISLRLFLEEIRDRGLRAEALPPRGFADEVCSFDNRPVETASLEGMPKSHLGAEPTDHDNDQ
ncbi:MAG: polysaccharide deacetylase family protein [Pseudomonadota bacterium]